MICEKVRFPDGSVTIVCGRRKKTKMEKQLTLEQQKFLDLARNASARCFILASQADDLGFPVLAREFDYLGKELGCESPTPIKSVARSCAQPRGIMICKDCQPVFYTRQELLDSSAVDRPTFRTALDNQHMLVLKHVELCPRHATAEANATVTDLVSAEYAPEAKERRRYALLQAAAILAKYNTGGDEQIDAEASVNDAEMLLEEIETRETEPQS